eukprot:1236898-Amphidinium_carterae.1
MRAGSDGSSTTHCLLPWLQRMQRSVWCSYLADIFACARAAVHLLVLQFFVHKLLTSKLKSAPCTARDKSDFQGSANPALAYCCG